MLVEKVLKTLESPPLRTGSHLGVDVPLRAVARAVAMAVAAVRTLAVGLHATSPREIRWRHRHGCRPDGDGPRRKGPGVAGHHDWRGKQRLAARATPPRTGRGRRGTALRVIGLGSVVIMGEGVKREIGVRQRRRKNGEWRGDEQCEMTNGARAGGEMDRVTSCLKKIKAQHTSRRDKRGGGGVKEKREIKTERKDEEAGVV